MKKSWRVSLGFIFVAFSLCQVVLASASVPTSAILVDKKTNQLYLTQYEGGAYKIVKTYHTTLGRVTGDKEDDSDLKTPEGIYTFTSLLRPPQLQKKFGVMGLVMNFPNTYDKLAGHTGSGIMLHATDEPDRLKKNFDSLGCIVVNNDEILEIKEHIRLGLTPILVFAELAQEYWSPGKDGPLKSFFESWVKSWEKKELENYIDGYHSDFVAQGKNKGAWKAYKKSLNQKYASIEINPENVMYYTHPKYSMVTFTQNYRSKLNSGGWGHRSRGTKILYIAEEAGKPKIIAETFTNHMW